MERRTDVPRRETRLPPIAALGLSALVLALAGGMAPARAGADASPGAHASRWLSLGLLAGATQLDDRLADYQWDVTPRVSWGAQALVGTGPFAAGLRLLSTSTTQRMGGASDPSPTVHATSVELVGRGRVATWWGTEVQATAGVGRLHLGYDPDRVEIQTSAPQPVSVDLAPIDEWIGGGGLALRRPLSGPWAASVEVDRRVFGIDAARRDGDAIVVGRESFSEWSARFELAWMTPRR